MDGFKECTKCGNMKHLNYFSKGRGKFGKHQWCKCCVNKSKDEWIRDNPKKYLLASAKGNASKKGQIFDINESHIIIPEYCPVLGIKIDIKSKNRDFSASIDRIDNNKGYTPDNIVVISGRANRIKSDSSIEELDRIIRWRKSMSRS